MEDYKKKYLELKNDYDKLQYEHDKLKNERQNNPPLNFAQAMERKIINNIFGNKYNNIEIDNTNITFKMTFNKINIKE